MAWDPITRIVGSLGIYTKIDFENREVVECHSTSSIFRGYSIFMKGKDPRDAHFITSRICGICGDNHATCSCYAQNMAYGVKPPHLGEWIVNLGEAAEYMFDHNIFQENLVGVDFCEKMVAETNPGVLGQGREHRWHRTPMRTATAPSPTSCARSIRSPVSSTGRHCRSAAGPREMFCLMEGRHVHPSTLYPGGVGTVATIQLMTDYMTRLMRYVEFMKKVVPDARRPVRLLLRGAARLRAGGPAAHAAGLLGVVPGSRGLQLRLQGHGAVGSQDVRHAGRGGGRQAASPPPWSTSTSASGSCWAARITTTGPIRRCSSSRIRWAIRWTGVTRGTSTPIRSRRNATWTDKYSWVMSPRWFDGKDHLALDTGGGPLARLWSTALAGLVDIGYVKSTGHSVQINLPKTALKGPVEFEWKIPAARQQHHRTQPGPHLLPGLRGGVRAAFRGEGAGGDPGRPHQDLGEVRGARRGHRVRLHRGGARRALATTW